MIAYQEESFTGIYHELYPLFKLHWAEVARHKDIVKLDVDYKLYSTLEDLGVIHMVTARDGDRLVGYIVSAVSSQLHYKSNIVATEDILYVHPEYRGYSIFTTMLKFAEEKVKQKGATTFYAHMKTAHDFSPVLVRQGYTEIERCFEKQL